MDESLNDKKLYINCTCSSQDHLLVVSTFNWGNEDETPDLYISTQLNHYQGFFRRCWTSLKFIFKRTMCGYGHWSESLISVKQAIELRDLLDAHISDSLSSSLTK